MTDKKKLGMQLRAAMIDTQSVNVEERTVEVVFATDTPVRMYSWEDGYVDEILSFDDGHVRWDRLNAGAPLLDNHQQWGSINDVQIGVVERAWKDEQGKGRAKVRFSKKANAESIWQDVQDKIVRNISVGYKVFTYQKTERQGQTPEYRAIDWEPNEISFVPVPADYKAGVRSEDQTTHEVVILNLDTDMEKNPTPVEPTTPVVSTPAPADDSAVRAAIEAERKRSADIFSAVRAARLGNDFAEKLIADGVSIDAARAAIIEKFAQNEPIAPKSNPSITVGESDVDKWRNAATDALVLRSAQVSANEFKPEQISAAREFRGMTLLDLAKESLERSGVSTRGMDKMEIAKRAITSSTSDFAVLLEGTNRRILLANYQATADTWRRFCAVGSVGDFREYKRLRMGSFSRLDKLPENAEYKNKPISDATSEKISAQTFGNTINVSRQMIVNDDLNAFTRLASMLGRAAARSIEIDVYALLASNPTMGDGKALFHADHGNLLASGAAPSVAQFEAMRLAMAVQMEPGANDYIDIRPDIWLGPIGLGGQARVVNDAQYDVDVQNKFQVPNKVRGLFRDIVDTPRLSGTAYYAFADPNVEPVLEVVFLDGVQTPFMDMQEGWNVDGIEWKIRLDYGVGAIGYRGVVKNPGA